MTNRELAEVFIIWIKSVKRYSERTVSIYRDVLDRFCAYAESGCEGMEDFRECLSPRFIRGYEVHLLENDKLTPRTVNLHLSVLSSFCSWLVRQGRLTGNPVKSVTRPKTEKRLPEFYRKEDMDEYFRCTEGFSFGEPDGTADGIQDSGFGEWFYKKRLARLLILTLYSTAIRRSELISLDVGSIDFSRCTAKIHGKGDKMREIPLIPGLCKEISLYLQSVRTMVSGERTFRSPLFVTTKGRRLYPEYIDRVIKSELGKVGSITGRKSPHVLRHTLATELLNEGSDLNSIKELLGHSSLAATQVYTHNSIGKLKKVYNTAHPRAKRGGKNGD